MIPYAYDLPLVENADNSFTFIILGITTTAGYSAEIDIRDSPHKTGNLKLTLGSSGTGITLSSNGTDLTIVGAITITQSQVLAAIIEHLKLYWSLKIVHNGVSLQYFNGAVVLTGTPTD